MYGRYESGNQGNVGGYHTQDSQPSAPIGGYSSQTTTSVYSSAPAGYQAGSPSFATNGGMFAPQSTTTVSYATPYGHYHQEPECCRIT